MKIYIASDHAGFELKNKLIFFLRGTAHQVMDKGAFSYDRADDYPDFVREAARAVAEDGEAIGIVIGGSGQGEAIAANRVRGVRAAVFYGGSIELVRLAREHNNANILSLGARFITEEEARAAVLLFMDTPFSGEPRHERRINKIDA